MHPALERFIQQFKATSDVVIDSWFICDNDRNIVDYNRAFFSLFPRPEARQLKAKKCHEAVSYTHLDVYKRQVRTVRRDSSHRRVQTAP